MILHTDFHDYYDTAIGYGIDANVHYRRFTKEVEINYKPKLDFPHLSWLMNPLLLGFCGEIYPTIEFVKRENYQTTDWFYAYNYEELAKKRTEWADSKEAYVYDYKRRENAAKSFFEDWRQQDDSLFLANKTPVWIYKLQMNNRKAVVNPKLKTYQFDRIRDANQAFQEISMYLSNILVEQKETAAVADKYRIVQHGFHSKTSFRKEKKK
jgi:hypothetical protein